MTPPTVSSPSRAERRAEFTAFYRATYPASTAELLALTGDHDLAHAGAGAAYARAWQAWRVVRTLDRPELWVRVEAIRQADRSPRAKRLLVRRRRPIWWGDIGDVDTLLISALLHLPARQRLLLVLHYMGQLSVDEIVRWFGSTVTRVDIELDEGYAALVEMFDRPNDGDPQRDTGAHATGDSSPDDAYAWMAQAFADSAQRLRNCVHTPSSAPVLRRAVATGAMRQGLPVVGAAVTLCAAVVVHLSSSVPASAAVASSPQPPAAAVPPAALVEPHAGGTARPSKTDHLDATPVPATPPAVRAATIRPMTATPRVSRSISVAAGSAVEHAIVIAAARAASSPR